MIYLFHSNTQATPVVPTLCVWERHRFWEVEVSLSAGRDSRCGLGGVSLLAVVDRSPTPSLWRVVQHVNCRSGVVTLMAAFSGPVLHLSDEFTTAADVNQDEWFGDPVGPCTYTAHQPQLLL